MKKERGKGNHGKRIDYLLDFTLLALHQRHSALKVAQKVLLPCDHVTQRISEEQILLQGIDKICLLARKHFRHNVHHPAMITTSRLNTKKADKN